MSEFKLFITSPNGIIFDGNAESVVLRTVNGDVGILHGHSPYTAALGKGKAKINLGGTVKTAVYSGGTVCVKDNCATIAVISFDWE